MPRSFCLLCPHHTLFNFSSNESVAIFAIPLFIRYTREDTIVRATRVLRDVLEQYHFSIQDAC